MPQNGNYCTIFYAYVMTSFKIALNDRIQYWVQYYVDKPLLRRYGRANAANAFLKRKAQIFPSFYYVTAPIHFNDPHYEIQVGGIALHSKINSTSLKIRYHCNHSCCQLQCSSYIHDLPFVILETIQNYKQAHHFCKNQIS